MDILGGRPEKPEPGGGVRLGHHCAVSTSLSTWASSSLADGEVEVRGPGVFLEYWRRPDVTREAFRDGWFRTGDLAVVEDGAYRLVGRRSVDIIKTGGYKVSAVEIEEAIRAHPRVVDCAIVGLPDPEWGERIGAAVELEAGAALSLEDLRGWLRNRLAPYKLPTHVRCVPALPRNAMAKYSSATSRRSCHRKYTSTSQAWENPTQARGYHLLILHFRRH